MPLTRHGRSAASLLLALSVVAATLIAARDMPSATAAPRIPTGLPAAIESLAAYVPERSCDPAAKPGAVKLVSLLSKTYPGHIYYISRACGKVPDSEHLEGRAVDWMTSVRVKSQARQASDFLNWLFAVDGVGHRYANARRLGVMYVIWNNKIWSAYRADEGWRPYRTCAQHPESGWDNTCHRNHMHISLSWEGARGRTSFWTLRVARPEYGSCRAPDLNWAPNYRTTNYTPCRSYPPVAAPPGSSALMKTLVTYSGMTLRQGSRGPAVAAVQRVVAVQADGVFGPITKAAVAKWQSRHGLNSTGTVDNQTWRSFLVASSPKTAKSPTIAAAGRAAPSPVDS